MVTTTSQYIDTGVLMQVTPHINAGGLVTLDVQAEVSNPGNLSANCRRRAADQHAFGADDLERAVGQTMVMGGLISETKQNASEGMPLLSRIPVLGGLFGSQTAHEQPHRARDVHHAARGRERNGHHAA